MRRSCSVLAATALLLAGSPPVDAGPSAPRAERAPAERAEQWSPPVDGPVVRGYEPPRRRYGPQHLGMDFGVPPGTAVRAAGDGVVAFAGLVGRSRSVAVEHGGGRRTTYAYLRRIAVRAGVAVRRGDLLGNSGAVGPGHQPDVVHFGYRVNGRPENPAALFAAPRPRISLAPLDRPACPAERRWQRQPPARSNAEPAFHGSTVRN